MNIIDQAVVGGIALHLKPGLATGFKNLRMLSPDGRCKCLDAKADGYCRLVFNNLDLFFLNDFD